MRESRDPESRVHPYLESFPSRAKHDDEGKGSACLKGNLLSI